jgi:hypothetical protein
MDAGTSLLAIAALIGASAFFSMAELSLAAARRQRLRQLADDGDLRAERVLAVQDEPGRYVTVVQIGLNAVAIAGGIVGEGALTPAFTRAAAALLSAEAAETVGFAASFAAVTSCSSCSPTCFPSASGSATRGGGATADRSDERADDAAGAAGLGVRPRRRRAVRAVRRDDDARRRVTHGDILAMAAAGTAAGVLAWARSS